MGGGGGGGGGGGVYKHPAGEEFFAVHTIREIGGIYCIAGKFDGELNLANWRFWTATVKV